LDCCRTSIEDDSIRRRKRKEKIDEGWAETGGKFKKDEEEGD
jgi:hypothetical protein